MIFDERIRDFLKYVDFRCKIDYWKLLRGLCQFFEKLKMVRSTSPSKGHLWVVRLIFSSEKLLLGVHRSYGPMSSGPKSTYGSYGLYIPLKKCLYLSRISAIGKRGQ